MAYKTADLTVLTYSNGFTLWNYQTEDAPTELFSGGYFNAAADLLLVGDMIMANAGVRAQPVATIMVCAGRSDGVVTMAPLWSPTSAPKVEA